MESEKRRDQRIHTAFPVHLENASGITRDVSASSVYFWTHSGYEAGQHISFSMELSRPVGRITLKCEGEVVRTELCDAMMGVAVRLTESAMQRL